MVFARWTQATHITASFSGPTKLQMVAAFICGAKRTAKRQNYVCCKACCSAEVLSPITNGMHVIDCGTFFSRQAAQVRSANPGSPQPPDHMRWSGGHGRRGSGRHPGSDGSGMQVGSSLSCRLHQRLQCGFSSPASWTVSCPSHYSLSVHGEIYSVTSARSFCLVSKPPTGEHATICVRPSHLRHMRHSGVVHGRCAFLSYLTERNSP